MIDADLPEFATLLDSLCALLTRGTYRPNDASTMIFFRALKAYPMDAVRSGFTDHACRSRFSPTPADILDLLRENDGRPGAEEAWSIALTGRDERDTIVWTREVAQAWGCARIVLDAGDEVGARMAFRQAYERMVDEARRERRPVVWSPAYGTAAARRADALRAAAASGRIVADLDEALALAAPETGSVLALDGPQAAGMPADVRARLQALRDRLTARQQAPVSRDVEARNRTDELRAASQAKATAFAASGGQPGHPPHGEVAEQSVQGGLLLDNLAPGSHE